MRATQTLTRYKAWADKLFLSVVASVPAAELTAPRPLSFRSLIGTLNHSYAMDYVWQCHLLGKPHNLTTRNPENWPTFEELAANQRSIDEWYMNYADAVTEDELAEIVQFEFIGGGTGRMTRRDMVLHVVNHTTYHRGQAAAILYTLDIFPPATDMPVFLRQQSVSP